MQVEADGSDAWRAAGAVELLKRGGVVVLPTDTSYALATTLSSKDGLERILRIKVSFFALRPMQVRAAEIERKEFSSAQNNSIAGSPSVAGHLCVAIDLAGNDVV